MQLHFLFLRSLRQGITQNGHYTKTSDLLQIWLNGFITQSHRNENEIEQVGLCDCITDKVIYYITQNKF